MHPAGKSEDLLLKPACSSTVWGPCCSLYIPFILVYNIHWPETGNPNIPSCFCCRAAAVQAAAVAMCSPGPETQLLCIRIKAGSCLGTVINANASWVVLKIAMDVWEYRDIKTTLLKVICKLAEINTIKI